MTTTTRNLNAAVNAFLYRVAGATLLDGSVYEDVEADRRAGVQATAVVLLASLAPVVGLSGIFGFQKRCVLPRRRVVNRYMGGLGCSDLPDRDPRAP